MSSGICISKTSLDLLFTHILGVPLVVKQNEPSDPFRVRFFSSDGKSLKADALPDLIQQFEWGCCAIHEFPCF
jgi:hypothetical protein